MELVLVMYIVGGVFSALMAAIVYAFIDLHREADKTSKELFALPPYRIIPFAHGSWALHKKTLTLMLGGSYLLSWRPEGIYASKEEAEKDLLHLTQNGE